jgi:hypothetical protein
VTRFSLLLAASVGAFLWTNPAHAVTCVPTPTAPCPSDSIKITDANGTVINDIFGNPASAVINEGDATGEGNGNISFTFTLSLPSVVVGVALVEGPPDANGGAPLSDVVTAQAVNTASGTGTQILFESDGPTPGLVTSCTAPSITCITETGSPQDVTADLFPGTAAPPFHVIVQSDAAEVPEPGTLLLLGGGLGGLVAIGARRRRV